MQQFVIIVFCALFAFGCQPPRSEYRAIHQYAIDGDEAKLVADLAERPNDVNLTEDHRLTPLHLAVSHCRTNVINILLAKGAKIEAKAEGDTRPIHLAAQSGCMAGITMLVQHGAKVNPRDAEGRTPLTRAKQWHHDEAAELLRKSGGVE